MILHWSSLREECPSAVQLIELKTGFKYEPAYGTLLNESQDPIAYANLEGFFDDHGWFMTIYPTEFPGWNGVISDSTGKQLLNNPALFEGVTTRNHAKSLLAGTAIKFFNEQLKQFLTLPKNVVILEYDVHVRKDAGQKLLEQIQYSDLTLDGMGLVQTTESMAVLKHEGCYRVMKNTAEFPPVGFIIKAD